MLLRWSRLVGLTAVVTCLAGCSAGKSSWVATPRGADLPVTTVRVEGKITEEGIECIALRSDAGELFTLVDVPDPFSQWRHYVGMSFLVIGEESPMSRCMQGRTLRVVSMSMIDPTVR